MSDSDTVYEPTMPAMVTPLASALNSYLESLGGPEAQNWHPLCIVDENGKGVGNIKRIRVGTYTQPDGREIPGMLLVELDR